MKQAVGFMRAGALISLAYSLDWAINPKNYPSANSATHHSSYLAAGIINGVVQCALWLWMAWKTRAGRGWARVVSTVFFGLFCIFFLGAIAADTTVNRASVTIAIILAVEWLIGLAAVILLWRRESGEFFRAARDARSTPGYGYVPPGYKPPGYGQPGYGQQGYGEPGQEQHAPYYGEPPQYGDPPRPAGRQHPRH